MTSAKSNCWEDRSCGRQPGGAHLEEFGPCPAATDTTCDGINGGHNAGRFCWAVPATLCDGAVQGAPEQKIEQCQRCSFFRRVKYEEGPHFQLLKPGLGSEDPAHMHRLLNNIVMLVGISRDILACLAVRPLLERIAEHACTITRSSSASAYLVDGPGQHLIREAHAGPVNRPSRIALGEQAPTAEAARSRRLCKGALTLPGLPQPVSVAAVPIGGYEAPPGVLELVKVDGRFSADDEWFLREFGLIAGLGLENARHVDDLRLLKRFDKAKSRFVAMLMHHITSPLATIACSLQALSKLGPNLSADDRKALLANSLERIGSVQALSKRLLDLAAIRSGSALAAIRPVAVAEPLRQEVESREAKAQEKGIELVMAQRGGESPIRADPDGLRVIFGNLIDNAIKYSTGPVKRVDVEVTDMPRAVRVSVRDRGIGIPADEQARIFEEFHRASNVAAGQASGFGLGLAIVKELVDRYGGRIDLQSEVGVGTTISIEFSLPANTQPQGGAP